MRHRVTAPQATGQAETATTHAAELDQVRAEAERTLAAELTLAQERHRTEIARLETEAAERRDAATRDAQARAEAQADETLAAELDRVRADAERRQTDELALAQERHRTEIARLETEAAERRDAATRDAQARAEAQADETLAIGLDRVRTDAERRQADELALAQERHRAEIARLETEAAESRDAATRDAQARAEAQADETLGAERDRMRAEAELTTLAARLATADERHRAEIANLENEAAESRDAATRDAQARAEAEADHMLAAEWDRMRAEAELTTLTDKLALTTLADKLAETEERHRAEIARLETEAAESRDAAARDAQARAEAHADTLAAERERVRTDAERTLSAELAAAQERHDADITRLETEAGEKKKVATRSARAAADGDRLPATAPSTSIALRPLEPVYRGAVGSSDTTDYYSLWRARSAAYAPRVETSVARPQRVDPRRRRWTLSVAATVLILLTNNLESGSAPHQALATVEAAGGSHAIGPTRTDRGDASRAPVPGDVERHDPGAPATGGNPDTGMSGRAPLSTLMLETMCVLVVMLLLRVTLFVGEGLVWHGLVVTLGFILLGFAVMRAPWGG